MVQTWFLIVAAALGMAACDAVPPAGGQASGGDTLTAVARVQSGMGSQATAVASLDASQQFAQRAREEAAKVLGVPIEQLTVDKVESVRWSDSSLGCAEPGKAYAQVLTPGIRIVLSGGGQKVEVHGDTSGRMVVCKSPTE